MYVRLAFAVAAHLDTDILLVDEVLAVGDLDFQRSASARSILWPRAGVLSYLSATAWIPFSVLARILSGSPRGLVIGLGETTRVVGEYLGPWLVEC